MKHASVSILASCLTVKSTDLITNTHYALCNYAIRERAELWCKFNMPLADKQEVNER